MLCLSNIKAKQNIDIEKLGISNDAIEWMQMLNSIAYDPYNKYRSWGFNSLLALNKLLEICFEPDHYFGDIDFLSTFYKAFWCNVEDLVLYDGSFLHDNSAIKKILDDEVGFLGRISDDTEEDMEAEKKEYREWFTFANHDKSSYISISIDEINGFALEKLFERLRHEQHETRSAESDSCYYSRLRSHKSEWEREKREEKKNRKERIKKDILSSIEEANKHDPSMTPDEWFSYLAKKNEEEYMRLHPDEDDSSIKETGEPDGND